VPKRITHFMPIMLPIILAMGEKKNMILGRFLAMTVPTKGLATGEVVAGESAPKGDAIRSVHDVGLGLTARTKS